MSAALVEFLKGVEEDRDDEYILLAFSSNYIVSLALCMCIFRFIAKVVALLKDNDVTALGHMANLVSEIDELVFPPGTPRGRVGFIKQSVLKFKREHMAQDEKEQPGAVAPDGTIVYVLLQMCSTGSLFLFFQAQRSSPSSC